MNIFQRYIFSNHSLYFGTQTLTCKRKSPHSDISKSLYQLQHQLKSKNLIHFLSGQKPQMSSFKSSLSKTLDIIHLGAKFHSICGAVEYKLHASKMQWWNRHKIAVIDIPIQNRKVQEEKKYQFLSTFAWDISWTEEPGFLQSMRSQRVRCD